MKWILKNSVCVRGQEAYRHATSAASSSLQNFPPILTGRPLTADSTRRIHAEADAAAAADADADADAGAAVMEASARSDMHKV